MIHYKTKRSITVEEFIDVLNRSTLAERRPVAEYERMQQMLNSADVLITAWDGDTLVGVSRALSDFSFCTYLADLAVDEQYQQRGIGKKLLELTHEVAGSQTNLILLAAPKAVEYYPKIGMKRSEVCYVKERNR